MTHESIEAARSRVGDPAGSGGGGAGSAGGVVFPEVDWVFVSDLVVGQVAPGHRDGKYNGHPIHYRPWRNVGEGARWCSEAWLARPDTGQRGPLIRNQGGVSRMGMHYRGVVKGGDVVVVPEDQVDVLAAVAAYLITRRADGYDDGVGEWSVALVREASRTRLAVGFGRIDDAARQVVRDEVDVEWFISCRSGFGGVPPEPDTCTISLPDGSASDARVGLVHHDSEALPHRLVAIARSHGVKPGRHIPGDPFIRVRRDAPYRPLEPDELAPDDNR